MIDVKVVAGDIARVRADALITAINRGGAWHGGIDNVIYRAAGNLFHKQAAAAMPLREGQTINANGGGSENRGAFTNVVFVVDGLRRPLREIIYLGLKTASDAKYEKVSLPTIRMGVMLGIVENSAEEAVSEMAIGVHNFAAENPETSITKITFVVFNDPGLQNILTAALAKY